MKPVNILLKSANQLVLTPGKALWRYLIGAISMGNELQVWQKNSRYGDTYWHVYDPATGHSTCFGTEVEVRMWIEQRYYQTHNETLRV